MLASAASVSHHYHSFAAGLLIVFVHIIHEPYIFLPFLCSRCVTQEYHTLVLLNFTRNRVNCSNVAVTLRKLGAAITLTPP